MKKVIMSWSGGKDSSFSLYQIQKSRLYTVATLLTTLTGDYNRISMHGVRRKLLEEQANALSLPLEQMEISKDTSCQQYERQMRRVLEKYKANGVEAVVFGDIFLEDLKKFREKQLAKVGMKAIFPIWRKNTSQLAKDFIAAGFRAIITCADSKILDKKFCGRDYDERFLSALPAGVDPCGENGEFHSFVRAGPIFKRKIKCKKGKIVLRDKRFYFCDLIQS